MPDAEGLVRRNFSFDALGALGTGLFNALFVNFLSVIARREGADPLLLAALAAGPFTANTLFAGAKGFCGGFGRRSLEPWGEPAIKAFVREALDEALKLESALARLRTSNRIALLHYAPIVGTVEGEPLEIYPFLGSSRLEEPINRYPVDAVLHGHAHHGSPEGRTSAGVPVYNVSMPLLKRLFPDRPAFRALEVARDEVPSTNGHVPRAEAITDRIGAAARA